MQHIMAAVPSPRAFNRDLSEQVEHVLLKGLAKTPEERFQTGAEFVAALAAALQAMVQHPARVSTADLPPLPPGITPPDPRRMSMQTALDKVNQEMALTQAKGQAVTRYPQTAMSRERQQRTSGWLPYLAAIVGALLALGVIGVLVIGSFGNVAVPTTAPTTAPIAASIATAIPTTANSPAPKTATMQIAAVPTITGTRTAVPTLIPTSQVILPSITLSPVPPTAEPPGPTSVPPTVLPTTIPPAVSPTMPPTIPPATQSPNGHPITLIWDENVFYLANKGSQRLPMSNIAFERVLKSGGFANLYSGSRWARYSPSYPYVEPRKCVILEAPGKGARYLRDDCPLGQNAEIYATRGELFWTPDGASEEFRVLWNNQEVARCAIAQQRCELRLAAG
jgi:hypothetical protein